MPSDSSQSIPFGVGAEARTLPTENTADNEMSTAAKPKPGCTRTTAIVTKAELEELALAESRHEKAAREASEAKKQVEALRLALAEKVLLIKSADDLKELSPEELDRKLGMYALGRIWKAAGNAPHFKFVKYHEGQYPAWKQLYIGELGEAAAARVIADTPKIYSYKVEVEL